MDDNPTYDELQSANKLLKQKVEWLEGIYHTNKDEGIHVKSRFLSNISHEIRTPMNAIQGFADLLTNHSLTTNEREEYVQYISHNSQELLKVLDNVLDLTLLETDNLKINQEEVFAEELFREIYEYFNSRIIRAMHNKVTLVITSPVDYRRVTIKADGYRLRRMLENLIQISITNQMTGVIEMKMEVNNDKKVLFSIIGTESELLEKRAKMVFENNGNTDDWHNHLDSTGLVLKLLKELVNAMGGYVRLIKIGDDRLGITIELPINEIGSIRNNGSKRNIRTLMN